MVTGVLCLYFVLDDFVLLAAALGFEKPPFSEKKSGSVIEGYHPSLPYSTTYG
jgi:hypothetical protein